MRKPIFTTLAAFALALLAGCSCGDTTPAKTPKAIEPAPVVEAPKVEEAPPTPIPEPEAEALKQALFGTKKPVVEAAPEPKKKVAPRRTKRVRRVEEVDDALDFQVASGLSDLDFQSTIGGWHGMRRCLAEGTARAESKNGALRVSFQIKNDGSVARSKVIESSNAIARAIAPCVERRARRIRFPAFPGGESVEKTAKFVF